jgi:hypothetical protein
MNARMAIVLLLAPLAVSGCNDSTAPPRAPLSDVAVASAVPTGGATGVDPAAPIAIRFNRSMMSGMELLVLVHEGSVTGPAVAGTATWSVDRTVLTFAPSQTLKSNTTYVLHLSPNLKASSGQTINFASCAQLVGGEALPGGMMNGGMMGNGGQGMMSGPGWQPGSGIWGYGMILTFTTR